MRTPLETLTAEHLDIRHQLLEIAAFLDRLEQGDNPPPAANPPLADDLRLQRIHKALQFLAEPNQTDRARQLALLFSGSDAEI